MKFCLRIRKEHCYFHLGVPTDLPSIIQKPEILKSLHANNRKSALILKVFLWDFPWHPRLSMVYYNLRSALDYLGVLMSAICVVAIPGTLRCSLAGHLRAIRPDFPWDMSLFHESGCNK
jgi:hypothetical protein